jgi:hypothetical protein
VNKFSFILFFTAVLCLAFLQGCTTPSQSEAGAEPQTLAECNKIQNPADKDICYSIVGQNLQDASICDQIKQEISNKDSCYNSVAEAKQDVSLCGKIQGSTLKDACYMRIAYLKSDLSLCDQVQSQTYKDACKSAVSEQK